MVPELSDDSDKVVAIIIMSKKRWQATQLSVGPTRLGKRLKALFNLAFTILFMASLTATHSGLARAQAFCDVRQYGATGDGVTLDTSAINKAIEACGSAGGGQVLIPPGRYLSGTLDLRSHVTLFLAAGATLMGTTNLAEYHPPGDPSNLPFTGDGNWDRGLIVAKNANDISICGLGAIDGKRVFDPQGEEHMRGPHTIAFIGCTGFTIRDVTIVDSANYAIFFQVSDDVEVRNVKISGGWDGVHFRGTPSNWCRNVNIFDCQLFTGDDSVAGCYWDNAVISGCTLNSSCNGIRLIGPARHLIVNNCLFYGPGLQPHRTQNRNNNLSGIILQPGAWGKTEGVLDDILIANNTMKDVGAPVTIWSKPGNRVGSITVSGLEATGLSRSAFSVESWSDVPITNVVLRNVHLQFVGGGRVEPAVQVVQPPHVDVRSLPAWAFYARNVLHLTLEDVRFSLANNDTRPVIMADTVACLTLNTVKFPTVPRGREPARYHERRQI
jgi:polygalacturonase